MIRLCVLFFVQDKNTFLMTIRQACSMIFIIEIEMEI